MNDKEAIERLKRDIITPLACGDTTIVIIDDLQTVLNLIEKQKAEIEEKQDDINVLQAQRDSIENQFEQAKAEVEKLKFYLSASEQEHKHDVKMIDEVKGEAVKLYKEIREKDTLIHTMQAEFERLEDLEDNTDILKMELKKKNNTIEELKKENHNLKEKLQMFIPRRRVRRVYKMIGKILRTDIDPILLEEELKSEQL